MPRANRMKTQIEKGLIGMKITTPKTIACGMTVSAM
jgi:hypothetical protein